MIIGNIDVKAPNRVSGLCYNSEYMHERLEIYVRYCGSNLTNGRADTPRADLEKLVANGDISFNITFPPVLDPAKIEVYARSRKSEKFLKFNGRIVCKDLGVTGATTDKDVPTKSYDAMIPIGANCELGWQLNKRYGKLAAALFQWGANQSRCLLSAIVKNPDLIFQGEIVEDPAHNM